jgi:hypothetical protein
MRALEFIVLPYALSGFGECLGPERGWATVGRSRRNSVRGRSSGLRWIVGQKNAADHRCH